MYINNIPPDTPSSNPGGFTPRDFVPGGFDPGRRVRPWMFRYRRIRSWNIHFKGFAPMPFNFFFFLINSLSKIYTKINKCTSFNIK